ncbi:MAG TPA: hypothetical protein VED18_13510 [Candidatus Sulfotelmatobacter sp.]|nr:hypothetical protein [Candidatus Sulfotelmatobacter sp.]
MASHGLLRKVDPAAGIVATRRTAMRVLNMRVLNIAITARVE